MAIINSLAIGKSVKSAGNLTYKTVRGRTIASQRITQNKSNTPLQQNQRERFAKVSESMKLIQQYIDACFEKSKYGSSRNAFFSINKRFTLGGLVGEISEGIVTLSDGMLSALTEEPLKQLSFLSFGSLAGFISISYKDIANYKYKQNTYGTLRTIDVDTDTGLGTYTFNFATGVKYSDVVIKAFGFSDTGVISATGSLSDVTLPSFQFGSSKLGNAMANCKPIRLSDDNDFLAGVTVAADFTQLTDCPIIIAVPVVAGKVPSISGIFAKESEV